MDKTDNSSPWMFWLALIALLAGLGIGIWALSAPAGIWFGWWPFGTGFGILQQTTPFAPWIAMACVLIALLLLVLAHRKDTGDGVKLFSLAAIGALAAGIAWYIPTSYAQLGEFPAIHDISTDTDNPPEYVAILPLRAEAPNTTVYGEAQDMTPELNASLQTEAYPDLVTRRYNADAGDVFERALEAVDEMGWELVEAVPEEGRIEATATTFWFRFKDDVVIRIQPDGNQTLVDARSLSRVGRSDVGANARRLREFFTILDTQ